ncbi:MAG: hypothetical protein ABIZ34_04300 [Candidatus Limnocylindrales bacterium]
MLRLTRVATLAGALALGIMVAAPVAAAKPAGTSDVDACEAPVTAESKVYSTHVGPAIHSRAIHVDKSQDIEVENDETHWVGHDRIRQIGGGVVACRAATIGGTYT